MDYNTLLYDCIKILTNQRNIKIKICRADKIGAAYSGDQCLSLGVDITVR